MIEGGRDCILHCKTTPPVTPHKTTDRATYHSAEWGLWCGIKLAIKKIKKTLHQSASKMVCVCGEARFPW
jgi:hypothetical protein